MKLKSAFFVLLVMMSLPVCAQNIGDRLYKKVSVDGKSAYRWVDVFAIEEFDQNGNETYFEK